MVTLVDLRRLLDAVVVELPTVDGLRAADTVLVQVKSKPDLIPAQREALKHRRRLVRVWRARQHLPDARQLA